MEGSTWQIASSARKSGAMAVGCVLVGALFIWLTRHVTPGNGDGAAAMWLGVLLVTVGVAGILFREEVLTTVDPLQRRLVFDRRTRWGQRRTVIPFGQIESVQVAKVGSSSDGTPSYWLHIQPKRGTSWSTGLWSLSDAETGRLAERLAADLGCPCHRGASRSVASSVASTAALQLAGAALGAVGLYALWFRLSVGPFCPAMWFGTAPPVLMLSAFTVLLGVLRRFWP